MKCFGVHWLFMRQEQNASQAFQRGVTLLEMLVVIAMIGIFSTAALVAYPALEHQRKAALAAQQIAADLRFAQNQALSFKKHTRTVDGKQVFARGGYGVAFRTGITVSFFYKIFADINCKGFADCDNPATPFPEPTAPMFADGGTPTTLEDVDVGKGLLWRGGRVFIIGGTCAGNVRFIASETDDVLTVERQFTDAAGNPCSPDTTSEYVLFGHAFYNENQGELVQEVYLDGARVSSVKRVDAYGNESVVPCPCHIVFVPPASGIRVNRKALSAGERVAIEVRAEDAVQVVDVYANGFIEIR